MSRRRRRRRKGSVAGGGGLWTRVAIGLIVVLIVVFAAGYAAVRGYLHSDSFREFLSAKVSDVAEVEGAFSPFRWDGLAVETSSFEAEGEGLVRELRVDGMHTEIGLGGLKRGVWEIRESRVQRMLVEVDARGAGSGDNEGVRESKRMVATVEKPGWLPEKVELQGLDVGEVVVRALLKQGLLTAEGMRMRVEPAGGRNAYRVELTGGEVEVPLGLAGRMRLQSAKLRYQDDSVFLNRLAARVWEAGRLEAEGEWNGGADTYSVEGRVSGVRCDEVFDEDWSKRLTGTMLSGFSVNNLGGDLVARGHLRIENGTLTALPVLDTLAAYADTQRFRMLTLTDARTDWKWSESGLEFTNLVLASEGLIRLEGRLAVRGEQLDGTFRLGMIPGALAKIPGAEEIVFVRGERGLMWTPLRITGTLDDPKEDLSDRLVDAAGLRMFEMIPETGEKVIKYTRKVIEKAPVEVVDEGLKIIEKGTKTIDDVGGIIDGFFGSGQ